jgi:hypothetical protein
LNMLVLHNNPDLECWETIEALFWALSWFYKGPACAFTGFSFYFPQVSFTWAE